MLKIFYGRENMDMTKFIFDNLQGKTVIIVPDQFTLAMEKAAFDHLGGNGLINIEVVSISRFGSKILKETGGGKRTFIGKQGKHMLMTSVLNDIDDTLELYKGYSKNTGFIDMASDFISEMKQYETKPADMDEFIDASGDNSIMHYKLCDMQKIYQHYEEGIKDKYNDSEDYTRIFTDRIARSANIRESSVWVYGFNYLPPASAQMINQLSGTAKAVNLVMTWDGKGNDFFAGGQKFISEFKGAVAIDICEKYGRKYLRDTSQVISHLEQNLFCMPIKQSEKSDGLKLVTAANYYAEAETAAAYVLDLIMNKGLRMRDIAVVCNDQEVRGGIFKRVFAQYGIDLFMDMRRDIMHDPSVRYIISLMNIISEGYRRNDIISLMKTGLTDVDKSDVELIENYSLEYGIRSTLWKKDFNKGADVYGQDFVDHMNDVRTKIITPIMDFAERYKKEKTVEGKIRTLYAYLSDTVNLPEKICDAIDKLQKSGEGEIAQETSQVWKTVIYIMEQLVEILGPEPISMKDLNELIHSGFESSEIGMLPPTVDGIMMSSAQHMMIDRKEALILVGVNEGVLPAQIRNENILNEDEREKLKILSKEKGIGEICKAGNLNDLEENLAIYRNIARTGKYLFISCAVSDEEGKATRPSKLFNDVQTMFPNVVAEKDVENADMPYGMVWNSQSTLRHLTHALRKAEESAEIDDVWKDTLMWYEENDKRDIEMVKDGLFFRNEAKRINRQAAMALYNREKSHALTVSPSRLEEYGRCPFRHFVDYGLRPEVINEYVVRPVDIGDVYHRVLMKYSQWLTGKDVKITDPASKWMTINSDESDRIVRIIFKEEMDRYREGILSNSSMEEYRSGRMQDTICKTAWMIINQVRSGTIDSMRYEIGFGQERQMPPLKVKDGDDTVFIEGKIDRIDFLPDNYVKIIDYKSGNDKYNEEEAKSGWKLQLFIYLKAAMSDGRLPAGTFYFHIKDPLIDLKNISAEDTESIENEFRKIYRMDGVVVDNMDVIKNIDKDLADNGGASYVIPVNIGKTGMNRWSNVMSEEDFSDLLDEVDDKIKEMCCDILDGDISIHPKVHKNESACTYCEYKGICKFDVQFDGCRYEKI